MPKKLWTAGQAGEKIQVLECRDDRDEASRVIDRVENGRREQDTALRDMVILYRTNAQSRSFEEVLRRRGIRYVIVGGLRFYERKEVKDILAHLRCMVNPNDVLSYTRAISNPKRGVGERSIEKLEAFAVEKKISFRDALDRAGEVLTGGSLSKVVGYRDMLDMLSGLREKHRIVLVLREVDGMSCEEIAVALGCPVGTVESRLHRGGSSAPVAGSCQCIQDRRCQRRVGEGSGVRQSRG